MRRFSQRSSLVTLSEINITPLLDLAFVLLIIFVITTPLLEQGLNLKLPQGGRPDSKMDPRNTRTVEVSAQGTYLLNRQRINLDDMEKQLTRDYRANTNLIILIRTDENARAKAFYAVIELCQRNGMTRYSLRTEVPKQ
jgi:biopolymer transport protein ExbD